jgi:sulfoxide reductase heme-binding subunit YedZ
MAELSSSENLKGTAANQAARRSARKTARLDWLRIAVHLASWLPLIDLAWRWASDGLTVNPIQFIVQRLGQAAAWLLVATLAVTPLVSLGGWRALARQRRTLGLYTFFYFALHFLAFAGLDYGLNWGEIARLALEKPFILVGSSAGLILLALAVTSFPYWMKRLGKNWKKLHRLIYLASGLVFLHYAWAVKGSLATLSGDILRPVGMGLLAAGLLLLRLPAVRERIRRIKGWLR